MVVDPATQAANQEKLRKFAASRPTCDALVDCASKWQAAQLWIVQNAQFKLQIATDVVLETYSPWKGHPGLAARVTKQPLGGTKYQLVLELWCVNPNNVDLADLLGGMGKFCLNHYPDFALDFNRQLGGAVPP
jgi:hypothetical protein